MVDTLALTAALCTAGTLQQAKALHVPGLPPTSLKTGDHVRVQTERRRAVRNAANSATTLEALRPMLERMKMDSAASEAKSLLDTAQQQLSHGNREEAMLTLDGASLRMEALKRAADGTYIDLLQQLQSRETNLRQQLGQPGFVPFVVPAPAPAQPNAPANEVKAPGDDPPVKPPKRDELPVG